MGIIGTRAATLRQETSSDEPRGVMLKISGAKLAGMAKKAVSPIPKGFHAITPSIVVKDAAKAIEFYKKAFGAKEIGRHYMPDGKTIVHADLKIGDSHLMMTDEIPAMQCAAPPAGGLRSSSLYLFVKNVDKVFDQAIKAGATPTMPVMDAFWGDRAGNLVDPFGHVWMVATRKKNLTAKQLKKASEEFMASMAKPQA